VKRRPRIAEASKIVVLSILHLGIIAADWVPAPQSFRQEIARHRELTNGFSQATAQWIEALPNQPVRVLIDGHWSEWRDSQWQPSAVLKSQASSSFTFAGGRGEPVTVPLAGREVRQILRFGITNFLGTANGLFASFDARLDSLSRPLNAGEIRQFAVASNGDIFAATEAGIYRRTAAGWDAKPLRIVDSVGRLWAAEDVLGVAFDTRGQLWFTTRAGVGCREGERWRFFEGKDGLPWNEFTAITAGPGGDMWFGTRLGAIRWDGNEFHYRQGFSWLPHDDVRALAVASDGSVWLSTAGGIGWIERRAMTLAEKARIYEEEIETSIQRTPYGYVAEASLGIPGDKSTVQNGDSDNDGLWTSMYGAGECFHVAATGDPRSKRRAAKAFEALRFLQKVTQGGTPAPDRGYIARTIRSVELPDPNIGRLASDLEGQKHDKLWKAYEPRWPKSADGKWFWKSDTSSDELDGHYFFYALYDEFVASSGAEKERVREVVRETTDHLMRHGGTMTDHDGKPTRWAVYGPQFLNRDPFWWPERGLNSLSYLSYLTVAAHLTGDVKYTEAANELIETHGYAHNAMYPKVQHGPGSGNQSDDEMAFMCYYTLLRYSKNEALKSMIRFSFYRYWVNEAPELNPFFNFAYAANGLQQRFTNAFGDFSIAPWEGWHTDSMATLRGFPLDRVNWGHKNSHRLDIQFLTHQGSQDIYEPRTRHRGHRTNGRVIPVENRFFNHWNTDPWELNYGGNGRELASGAVYLLPYYMGLYHGFIEKP
jgi:hypothetical protein